MWQERMSTIMARTESVLISVSVVVTAPVSDALPDDASSDVVQAEFINAIAERLRASVPNLKGEP